MAENESKTYKVKVKPVYNFQSIEIELEFDEVQKIIDWINFNYADILEAIKESTDEVIAPANNQQPVQRRSVQQPPRKKNYDPLEMPSERQYEIMDRFGIEYDDLTTKEEARKLIQESMKNS